MLKNKVETIIPKDEAHWLSLRTKDITSTEVSSLFGISPYCTEFELWHRKKELVTVKFEENERTIWGQRLQDSIALGIAKDKGFDVRKKEEYMRIPDLRIGSSFDFQIEDDGEQGRGLLEIKNVDGLQFKNGWEEDDNGNLEAPPHIELQVQHQLLIDQSNFAHIGALIGGNRVELIKRLPDADIQAEIVDRVAHFWKSIDSNVPPQPDFARDAEFLAKHIYNFAEPGKHIDINGHQQLEDLCAQYKAFGDAEKQAETQKKALKAQILSLIGDAEKATASMFTISAGITGPAQVEAYERAGFRNFRVTWKKVKA